MYRDVMFAITDTASDEPALDAAIAFAKAHGARLRVAMVQHLPLVATGYGLTPVVIDESYTPLRDAMKTRHAQLQARLKKDSELESEVTLTETPFYSSKQVLAAQARYADVVLVPAPGPMNSDSAQLHGVFATLAKSAGRPVITIPRDAQVRFPPRRVVVGWSATPEAARAVHDALPLLKGAQSVDIVLVEPEMSELRHGGEPGADIGAHLARHGITVNAKVDQNARGTVGFDLLVTAREAGADLIVVGAYGHSRAREWAFGGTTRELLDRAHIPVLFAH